MNRSSAIRQQLALWGLILGLWCLLVLAFAGHLVFTNSVPWADALRLSVRDWFPWVVLGPVAAWLAFHFPFERRRLYLSIPIHVTACMLAVFFCELMSPRPPAPLLGAPPRSLQLRFRGGNPPPQELPPFGPGRRPPDGPNAFRGPPEAQGTNLSAAEAQGLVRPPTSGAQPPGRRPPPGDQPPGRRPPDDQFPGRRLPEDQFAGRRPFPLAEANRGLVLNAIVNRAQFNVPIYWVIVSIVHALTYYRRSQAKEKQALELEARLSEAKLQALRMQLHPHFLFNTLNAISTLVHKDPAAADEMLGNLSELLRATLDTSEQEIPLREDLALLERYLEIQQARFGDRLRIEKEIDATALDGRVPTLILQPLVENAIRHGIEPQPVPGHIAIRAHRKEEKLVLSVRDNGVGMKKPGTASEGIGLANTKARLQTLYGPRARLILNTASDGGCLVEMELPYHT